MLVISRGMAQVGFWNMQ